MSLIPFASYYKIWPCPANPFSNDRGGWWALHCYRRCWSEYHGIRYFVYIIFFVKFYSLFSFWASFYVRVIFLIILHAQKGKMFKQTQLKMRICCFILSITNMHLVFTRIYHLSVYERKNDPPPTGKGLYI